MEEDYQSVPVIEANSSLVEEEYKVYPPKETIATNPLQTSSPTSIKKTSIHQINENSLRES